MSLRIRAFRADDAAALGRLFFESVHRGTASAYSEAQRAAWAPEPPGGPVWAARLGDAETLVAEIAGAPAGFMSVIGTADGVGVVDMAFVHPDHMGKGIASALYAALEEGARARGLARLELDASAIAKPFFAAKGFTLICVQQPVRGGVALTNYRMGKAL
ncbi:MAG: GNAT family N-acetyltransferase [Nitratireductor sp.]